MLSFAAVLLPQPACADVGDAINGASMLVTMTAAPALVLGLIFLEGTARRRLAVIGLAIIFLLLLQPFIVVLAFVMVGSGTLGLGLMGALIVAITFLVIKGASRLVGEMKPKDKKRAPPPPSSGPPVWAVAQKQRAERKPSALELYWKSLQPALAKHSRTIQCSIGLAVMIAFFLLFYLMEWRTIVIR